MRFKALMFSIRQVTMTTSEGRADSYQNYKILFISYNVLSKNMCKWANQC